MNPIILKWLLGGNIIIDCFGSVSWAVEQFAKEVAVKARARSLRRFFVSVLRTTWDVVNLVAKTVDNVTLMTDSMSYSDYPDYLDYNDEEVYEYAS